MCASHLCISLAKGEWFQQHYSFGRTSTQEVEATYNVELPVSCFETMVNYMWVYVVTIIWH